MYAILIWGKVDLFWVTRVLFSTGLQCLFGIEIPIATIASKRHQMACDVIHCRSPAPLSSENHEREPERQVCSQSSSIMLHEKNVRKKLVNVNMLLFRVTAPDIIPTRTWGMTSARAMPEALQVILNSPMMLGQVTFPKCREVSAPSAGSMHMFTRLINIKL